MQEEKDKEYNMYFIPFPTKHIKRLQRNWDCPMKK